MIFMGYVSFREGAYLLGVASSLVDRKLIDQRRRHESHETNPGCLGYVGDEKLPKYIGIIRNHNKDPY